jgi:hypothetical protein
VGSVIVFNQSRIKEFISSRMDEKDPEISPARAVLVEPDEIEAIWHHVQPLLEKSTPHSEGEMDAEDMFPILLSGEMQLWVAIENKEIIAAMVSQIITYPKKRVMRIISIGGADMEKWMPNFPLFENWALNLGCTSIEAWGRKGWLRVLDDWKCSYHIITKDLTHRMH